MLPLPCHHGGVAHQVWNQSAKCSFEERDSLVTQESRSSLSTLWLRGTFNHQLPVSSHCPCTLIAGRSSGPWLCYPQACWSSGVLVCPPPFSLSLHWHRGYNHGPKTFFLPISPFCLATYCASSVDCLGLLKLFQRWYWHELTAGAT